MQTIYVIDEFGIPMGGVFIISVPSFAAFIWKDAFELQRNYTAIIFKKENPLIAYYATVIRQSIIRVTRPGSYISKCTRGQDLGLMISIHKYIYSVWVTFVRLLLQIAKDFYLYSACITLAWDWGIF